ncbi:MAG: flagellar hook-basal body complex protein FliE [Ktedonobacterales bacterium]|nr:flagellar hook-basal body complex protein FliE [Ktedonobacterales bacterium]
MNPISTMGLGLSPVQMPLPTDALAAAPSAPTQGPSATFQNFSDLLGNAVEAITSSQSAADTAATQLVTGQSTDVHSVMIAMEKAKVTFDMAVQVRNKLLDGYNELMRTQV